MSAFSVITFAAGLMVGIVLALWIAFRIYENQEEKWSASLDLLETENGILKQKLNAREMPGLVSSYEISAPVELRRATP